MHHAAAQGIFFLSSSPKVLCFQLALVSSAVFLTARLEVETEASALDPVVTSAPVRTLADAG